MELNINFSFINIDKPSGPTSFAVSDFIRKSLNLKKTSHLGTLDPQVTGVLPIALGRACRLNEILMHRNKTYVGIMRLHKSLPMKKLNEEIKPFIGKITQLPPVRSRVKRAPREREVKSFKLLEKNGKEVLFQTEVQAGTYIRKLIHDLGEKIGGAHMLELRRTKAGIFTEESLINLYDFEKALASEDELKKILIPAEEIIKKVLPIVQASASSVKQLLTGKPVMAQDITSPLPEEETFALFNNQEFIGVYKKSLEKEIIARPVFIYN